jgi:hypothetical protein
MTDPYGGTDTCQYDALNRLKSVTRSVGGTSEHVESYGYNAIGGLHTGFDAGSMAAITFDDKRPKVAGGGTADAAVPNTLGGQGVTLNAGGQVTSVLGTTFTYDFRNLLRTAQYTAQSGDTIQDTYQYDSFLRRTERSHVDTSGSGSITTTDFYVHDGANLVARINGSNQLQDAFLFDAIDSPLRLSRGGTSYFYEVDLAGNVRRLRDASGADLGGYRYTAFGQAFAADAQTPAAAIDQPLRWKGAVV